MLFLDVVTVCSGKLLFYILKKNKFYMDETSQNHLWSAQASKTH